MIALGKISYFVLEKKSHYFLILTGISYDLLLLVCWNPIRLNGRRPKSDDSGKRSFPCEAQSVGLLVVTTSDSS